MKWLQLALRNSRRNARRSVITGASVAAGTIAILLTVGYMLATFDGVKEGSIRGGSGHMQIAFEGEFRGDAELPLQYGIRQAILEQLTKRVEAADHVHYSFPRLAFEGLITNGERTVIFSGRGVVPVRERRLARYVTPLSDGVGLDEIDYTKDYYHIVLGKELARIIKAKVGDFVTLMSMLPDGGLNAADFEVDGIIETGIPETDKRYVLVPIQAAKEFLLTEKVSRLVVVLDDNDMTGGVKDKLERIVDGLSIKTWVDLNPFYGQLVQLYVNQFIVFGVIIAIIVLLSITNTVFMSIMERVPEIGIMRSLGIPLQEIQKCFIYEAAIIGMIGSLCGVILTFVLCSLITYLKIPLPPPPGRTIAYPLSIYFDPLSAIVTFLTMLIISSIAAWFPSRHISKINVVEALKHT
jgi:putative ABC transport system permease protein